MATGKQKNVECFQYMFNFISNKSLRSLIYLIDTTRKLNEGLEKVEWKKNNGIVVVMNFAQSECVEECNIHWFQLTIEVLMQNNINNYIFEDALRQTITKGRQKM